MPSVLTPELRSQIEYCIREQFARVRAQKGVEYPTYRPLVSPSSQRYIALTGSCDATTVFSYEPVQLASIIPATPAARGDLRTTDLSIGTHIYDAAGDYGGPITVSGVQFSIAGTYIVHATMSVMMQTAGHGGGMELALKLNDDGVTGGIEYGHAHSNAKGQVTIHLPIVAEANDVLTLWFAATDPYDYDIGKLVVWT